MVVGWKEYMHLQELSDRLRIAKLDTGALTACLGVESFEVLEHGSAPKVRFKLAKTQAEPNPEWQTLPLLGWRTIRDSGGHEESRPLVQTFLQMGVQSHRREFTLTSRSRMRTKVLLGRKALRAFGFQIDPTRTFLLGRGSSSAMTEGNNV